MAKKSKVQVKQEHYYNNYDDLMRFISYFYQVDLTKRLRPKKVLEIGIGNKTVSNYLEQNGVNLTTCDIDKNLKPDCVADIIKLPFKKNSYDLVLAFEILEHLRWDDVNKTLEGLHRVTKKHIIISLPYSATSFEFILRFPLMRRILKKQYIDVFLRVPALFRKMEFNGEHYWEIGKMGYSLRKVRRVLKNKFKIIEEVRPMLNSYHYFFILEKI